MRYRSTRGGVEDCGFVDAVLMGLAPDRGLLVPKTIPKVDAATLEKWSKLPFASLATEIISLYIDESEISRAELEQLTKTAYSNWRSEHVTPVHHLDGDYHLLELFHGPTYAFKDVALQFLGVLFELIPVWKATSELGYLRLVARPLRREPLRQLQCRVDGVEPLRHRSDAVTGTTSLRWRRTSTPSSRRSYGYNIAVGRLKFDFYTG